MWQLKLNRFLYPIELPHAIFDTLEGNRGGCTRGCEGAWDGAPLSLALENTSDMSVKIGENLLKATQYEMYSLDLNALLILLYLDVKSCLIIGFS